MSAFDRSLCLFIAVRSIPLPRDLSPSFLSPLLSSLPPCPIDHHPSSNFCVCLFGWHPTMTKLVTLFAIPALLSLSLFDAKIQSAANFNTFSLTKVAQFCTGLDIGGTQNMVAWLGTSLWYLCLYQTSRRLGMSTLWKVTYFQSKKVKSSLFIVQQLFSSVPLT